MIRKQKRILFIVLAGLCGIAALYHTTGIFYTVNSSPAWRHGLFIVINLICIYGLMKRPRWFIWFFFLLLLQQLYSHGSDIIGHWKLEHRIDWISMVVIILMPLIFILLVSDRLGLRVNSDV
jgi:hypothetical protein